MRGNRFILEGHKIVPCEDLQKWAGWMQAADHHVGDDEPIEGVRVSTVFLGLNYSFQDRVPLLFETMVFADIPELDGQMERYSTWQDAEAGHAKWVGYTKLVKAGHLLKCKREKDNG